MLAGEVPDVLSSNSQSFTDFVMWIVLCIRVTEGYIPAVGSISIRNLLCMETGERLRFLPEMGILMLSSP